MKQKWEEMERYGTDMARIERDLERDETHMERI